MAGRFMDEMPGMSFGHAGTIVEGKEDTAAEKIARLADAGITVAEEISQIPEIMKTKLASHAPHLKPPGLSVPEWVRGGA
jgi:succinyl-CoA synthetase alpha subunit